MRDNLRKSNIVFVDWCCMCKKSNIVQMISHRLFLQSMYDQMSALSCHSSSNLFEFLDFFFQFQMISYRCISCILPVYLGSTPIQCFVNKLTYTLHKFMIILFYKVTLYGPLKGNPWLHNWPNVAFCLYALKTMTCFFQKSDIIKSHPLDLS